MAREILRTALVPGASCLSTDELARYADGALGTAERSAAETHVRGCLNCQAELALRQAVTSGDVRPGEADVVRDGVTLLERRAGEIFGAASVAASPPRGWFGLSRLPAAVAVVGLVVAAGLYLRVGKPPELPGRVTTEDEVTRSLSVVVRAPLGDQTGAPSRLEWRGVDGAVRYRVRLMEVDRREVWSTSTPALEVDLPAAVRTALTPGRTLLWDVTAYDASEAAIAESGRSPSASCYAERHARQAPSDRGDAPGARSRPRERRGADVQHSGRDGACGQHGPDEGEGDGAHADLRRPWPHTLRGAASRREPVRPHGRGGGRRSAGRQLRDHHLRHDDAVLGRRISDPDREPASAENLPAGSSALFTLEASTWTIGGRTLASKRRTATVTIGGTLAITDVVPAGATFPAGTVISVRGVGFDGNTRLRLNGDRLDDAEVVSPNEIQFTLSEPTNMAGAELRVDNSLGEKTIYYSYLRGTPAAATSKRPLLASTLPVFSGTARSVSTFGAIPALNPAYQYAALALQNPNLARADMTLVLYASNGARLGVASRSLKSGHRLLLELSELLPGTQVLPGSSLRVVSSRPIQMFGLIVDDRIRSVTPRLPVEARP